MSDSRPPIFDDGGGLPDVNRNRRRTDPGDPGSAEKTVWDHDDDDWHGPNYLVRRAIVVALVVAVIAVAAVLVGRIIGSDDSGSGSGFGNADWNNVVTVDNNSGTVVVTNAQGEETNRFRFGLSSLADTEVIGSTLISVDADELAVVPLDAEAEIAIADDVTTVEIASTGTLLRALGERADRCRPEHIIGTAGHGARPDRRGH